LANLVNRQLLLFLEIFFAKAAETSAAILKNVEIIPFFYRIGTKKPAGAGS
jgi:hypothetical protein